MMILRKELAASYCWLLILVTCFKEGSLQSVVINYPHYPVYGHNSYQSWNVTSGYDGTHVYPEHANVTVFNQYEFFVNEINFDTNSPGNFFIGAKDVLYEMNTNLSVVRRYQWPVTSSSASACASISIDTSFACHNHIRLYTRLPQATDRLWVCGTDAYNPVCRTMDISDISDESGHSSNVSTNNVGMISVHPALPALWGFQDTSQLLASGFYQANEWNDYDFARYNISYDTSSKNLIIDFSTPDRTIQSSDDFHIREPYHPISMYDVRLSPENASSGMYLFFFREREFKAQDSAASPVRSRVIRVCKNDVAKPSRFFGSLLKAEIFCAKQPLGTPEAFGAQTFYYTGLRDTHYGYNDSRWYGNRYVWDRLLYGAFTSEQYAPNGTAICVYYAGIKNFVDVSQFLDGNHRGVLEVFNQNHFLPKSGIREANSFLNCDAANGRSAADLLLAESGIQQYKGLYLPLLELPGEVVTKIAVDEVCVTLFNNTNRCMMQDVIFAGTNVGKIYKIVFTTKHSEYPNQQRLGLNGLSHDPVIAQEWQLADTNSVEQLYIREEDGKRFIYATTYSRVYKFAAYNCERHANCRDCLASRDPYCFWNSNTDQNRCEFINLGSFDESGEVTVTSGYLQNIHTGISSSCNESPYCKVQVTPNSPNGFVVEHDCMGTASTQLSVDSQGCPSNPLPSPFTITGSRQVVNHSSILGHHLYRVNFTATYSSFPSWSVVYFITTVGGAPSVPTASEVYATGLSNGRVQVVVTIDGCSLHSSPEDHTIFVSFCGVNGTVHCINSSQLYNGGNTFIAGSYYSCENVTYTVTITNSYGTSPEYSGIIQPYTTSPGQPETVTVSSISSDSATIRWTKPDLGVDNNYCDRITGYSVYINSVKKRDCIDSLTYTVYGLIPYTDYTFGIAACSEGGESSLKTVSNRTSCEVPSRVVSLRANVLSFESLSFTWNRPIAVNGTDLQYTLLEECFNQTTMTYDENTYIVAQTTHTVNSLAPLSICCLTVSASVTCNSAEYTSAPSIACTRTVDTTPGPIENLNIVATSPSTMFLTWIPPMNNTLIGILYEIVVMDPEREILRFETSLLYHSITEELQNDTEYRFCIVARNNIDNSSQVCMNATTLPSPPEAPTDVRLAFVGCDLIVTWMDTTSERYSVDNYNVSVQCNRDIRLLTVPAPTMSASFSFCASNVSELGLTWCAAQVFSENDVGPSAPSQWVNIVIPNEIGLTTPQCYRTEDIGHTVTFSYTLTSAYALNSLRVNYSLIAENQTPSVIANDEVEFNSANNITFNNLMRMRPYIFTLRVCDGNARICSQPCVVNFNTTSVNPAAPVDLRTNFVSFDKMYLTWSPPPNENSTFLYTVQVTGPSSTNSTRMTINTFILWEGLDPETSYSISIMATDVSSNISSAFSDRIIARTETGTSTPKHIGAKYYVTDDRLNIYWERPEFWNGTIINYIIIWTTVFNEPECQSLPTTSGQRNITDMKSLQTDVSNPSGLSSSTQQFLLCIAAETAAGQGDWNYTIITSRDIITPGGLTGENSSDDRLALALVTVVAILAILAAIVIMVIFLIACKIRQKSMSMEGSPPPVSANGSSRFSVFYKARGNRTKAVRTPERDNTQSIRSTAPMVTDGEC